MSEEQVEPREVGIDRLLALSDGVFAISLTLLVLDLRQPIVSHGLLDALLKGWSAYLGYVLSFLVIGIIWAQHHLMFHFIRRTDHVFLLLNLLFLMWVAVIPFPTSILAQYLENPGERQTAVTLYAGLFVVGGVLVNLRWLYAIHNNRLLVEDADPGAVRLLTRNYAIGPVLYLVDFALAFVSPIASITLLILTGLFYAFSPLLGRWTG